MDRASATPAAGGVPFAQLADGQWAEMQGDLFSDLGWGPYSGAWPRSGIAAAGLCFARPTWAPPTAGTGSSSSPLLLTPTAQLAVNGGPQTPAKRRSGGHGPTLEDQVARGDLLPTPNATDDHGASGMTRTRARPRRPGDRNLPQVAEDAAALLPSPAHRDHKGRYPRGTIRSDTGQPASPQHMDLLSSVETLLPTPEARDHKSGQSKIMERGGRPLNEVIVSGLLPTPRTTDRPSLEPSPATVRGTHGRDLAPSIGALLPTPAASMPNDGEDLEQWEARRLAYLELGRRNGNGQGPPLSVAVARLPTPRARDVHGARPAGQIRPGAAGGAPRNLNETVVNDLLPAPQAHDAHGAKTAAQQEAARNRGLTARGRRHGVANLNETVTSELTGSSTAPRSPGGKPSSDDEPLSLFSLPD